MRLLRFGLCALLASALLSLLWTKVPHIELFLSMCCNEHDLYSPSVVHFTSPSSLENVTPVRLGPLVLDLPLGALSPETQEGLRQGILRTEYAGMYACVFEPRPDGLPPLRDLIEPERRWLHEDEITLRIASYSANLLDFSWAMTRDQAITLKELLEVRQNLRKEINQIEVIHNGRISGLLSIQRAFDGFVRMQLDYESLDGALTGTASFVLLEESQRAMGIARLVINSMNIQQFGSER